MDISTLARFHIAPGSDPGYPDFWNWEDRSADVEHSAGAVVITGGRNDESDQVDPSTLALSVDNAGGHYCRTNPLGRWYGKLSLNTPVRWGCISGAAAFSTNAVNSWGTPDVGTSWTQDAPASMWSVSGGTGRIALASANTSGSSVLNGADCRNGMATFVAISGVVATGAGLRYSLIARRTDANDNILFILELAPSGVINAHIFRDRGGSFTTLGTTTLASTYSAGERIKARCQWDGPRLRMKAWEEAGAEPAGWQILATDTECQGAGVAVNMWRLAGNTNAGTLTMQMDDISIEAVEFTGMIAELPVRWDPTAQHSWVPLRATGVTRRMAQGKAPIRSPLFRQLYAQPGDGYWPLEDGRDATRGASMFRTGVSAGVRDATFGDTDAPGGGDTSVQLSSLSQGSLVTAGVRGAPSRITGHSHMALFKLGSLPVTDQPLIRFFGTGKVYKWQIYISGTGIAIDGVDADGTNIIPFQSSLTLMDHTKWFALQLETLRTGVNAMDWTLIWHQVGVGNPFYFMSNSYAGTSDRVTGWTATAAADNSNVSHVWVGPNTLPFVDTGFRNVAAGYASEPAADRIARLAAESGIPVQVEPGDSEPMGAQRIDTTLNLMRQTEATDMGVLYEAGAYLGYKPRGARYNAPVHFPLSITDLDLSDPAPEPTDDDQRIRNEWTVGRVNGSSETAADSTHITANGLYPDSVTIDAQSDERLYDHASWRLHLGRWPEMRWPNINLTFTDRDDLLTLWRSRPFGARMTITGIPLQGPIGQDADLIIEGWRQEIRSDSWGVTLNCSPARPWDVAVIGTARKDSRSTVLNGAVTSSATSITISTANPRETWATAGGYDLIIGGEVIGVPAAGMSSPTGTGPYTQTITGAVRAKNGISKGHSTGAPVSLATPGRIAL